MSIIVYTMMIYIYIYIYIYTIGMHIDTHICALCCPNP